MSVRTLVAVSLLLAVVCRAHGANISATVDRSVVGVNESFQLTFEADDSTGEPDFAPLREDFEILDQAHSKNLSIINGKTSRQLVWDLVLMATKTGDVQIPAISFGSDKSQAIDIKVKGKVEEKDREESMYLEVEFDNEQPYVQQQVIFSVRLFLRRGEVSSASLSELEIEGVDAIVERLGDDKTYQEIRKGVRWRVVERKYLVFPQQSGYMTIHPLEFRGFIRTRAAAYSFDIFRQTPAKRFVLRSESITLPVREPPAAFAAHWLPAKSVSLTEAWPAPGEIKVGEPVTREITVQAEGLSAAQLPELNITWPDTVRAYPEQPRLENTGSQVGVTGTRVETAAIIPTQPGSIVLPEVSLAWWNVDKEQPEIATIAARTLEVVAASAEVSSTPAAPTDVSKEAMPAGEGNPLGMESVQFEARSWWPWASLGLGMAWLITLILWVVDRQRVSSNRKMNGQTPPQVNPRQALADLKHATQANNAAACRDALLKWGRALWPNKPPTSLGQLANLCSGSVSKQIRNLEQVLYARKSDWDGNSLWQEIRAFKGTQGEKPQPKMLLEPLYKN